MNVVVTSFLKKTYFFLTQNKENIRCFFKKKNFFYNKVKEKLHLKP